MKFVRFAVAAVVLSVSTPALAACPTGYYDAVGRNPGATSADAPAYVARVTITDRGDNICGVEWDMGRQQFFGVALFDERAQQLHVSYGHSDGETFGLGVVSYRREGDLWVGDWAMFGDGPARRGREVLTRR